jgi:CheY-like chemotaxis protein
MKKKILLIDDDAAYRRVITDLLEDRGYIIDTAIDGKEGFEKANNLHPDLIILDIMMPTEHGLALLSQLSKDEKLKQTPIIIASNLESAKGFGDEGNVVGFVVKSKLSNDEFIKKVDEVLQDK